MAAGGVTDRRAAARRRTGDDDGKVAILTTAPPPWSFPDFRYFWVARFATMLAQSCTVLAVAWQVYDVSRLSMGVRAASLRLGMIGLVQFLPLLVCTLFSGWIADRFDRRRVAFGAAALHMACALALCGLAASGSTALPVYFALAGGLGVVRAFYQPAMNALAPNLVPRAVLPRALAANSIASRGGAIAGPLVGGFSYALAPWCAFAVSAGLLVVSLASIARLRPSTEHVGANRGTRRLSDIAAGFHYIRNNRLVFGAITLDLAAVLLGGVTALLPVFARDVLHIGPSGLGLLRAALAMGALASALLLTLRPLRGRVGEVMVVAVAIYGIATIGFGVSRWLPLSLLCLVILGAADMTSVYIRQSIVQLTTPNAMRGRVGALGTLSVSASNELGETESGVLAALLGPVGAVVAGGVGSILVVLCWNRWFPELRAQRDLVAGPE